MAKAVTRSQPPWPVPHVRIALFNHVSVMTISIQPLSGPLGAEVSGLDLSQALDDATIGEILDAWHAHELLLFRGQDISEDQQVGFAARFGKVAP